MQSVLVYPLILHQYANLHSMYNAIQNRQQRTVVYVELLCRLLLAGRPGSVFTANMNTNTWPYITPNIDSKVGQNSTHP